MRERALDSVGYMLGSVSPGYRILTRQPRLATVRGLRWSPSSRPPGSPRAAKGLVGLLQSGGIRPELRSSHRTCDTLLPGDAAGHPRGWAMRVEAAKRSRPPGVRKNPGYDLVTVACSSPFFVVVVSVVRQYGRVQDSGPRRSVLAIRQSPPPFACAAQLFGITRKPSEGAALHRARTTRMFRVSRLPWQGG